MSSEVQNDSSLEIRFHDTDFTSCTEKRNRVFYPADVGWSRFWQLTGSMGFSAPMTSGYALLLTLVARSRIAFDLCATSRPIQKEARRKLTFPSASLHGM